MQWQKKLKDLTNLKTSRKLVMITKENLLTLISEEKNVFAQYSQSCAQYQIDLDPLAEARHRGRLEALQALLQEKRAIKI